MILMNSNRAGMFGGGMAAAGWQDNQLMRKGVRRIWGFLPGKAGTPILLHHTRRRRRSDGAAFSRSKQGREERDG